MAAKVLQFKRNTGSNHSPASQDVEAVRTRRCKPKALTIKFEGCEINEIEDAATQTGRTVKQVLQAMRINILDSALEKFIDNPDAEEFCGDDDLKGPRKFFATLIQ
jgi:hypothetical protein